MGFLDSDLRFPSVQSQRSAHKRRRLVQGPNSYFMDVKCPKCFAITTVYSHATTEVACPGCATVLTKSTGGKTMLTEGCSFRKKPEH